jgi:hypothetical protein
MPGRNDVLLAFANQEARRSDPRIMDVLASAQQDSSQVIASICEHPNIRSDMFLGPSAICIPVFCFPVVAHDMNAAYIFFYNEVMQQTFGIRAMHAKWRDSITFFDPNPSSQVKHIFPRVMPLVRPTYADVQLRERPEMQGLKVEQNMPASLRSTIYSFASNCTKTSGLRDIPYFEAKVFGNNMN